MVLLPSPALVVFCRELGFVERSTTDGFAVRLWVFLLQITVSLALGHFTSQPVLLTGQIPLRRIISPPCGFARTSLKRVPVVVFGQQSRQICSCGGNIDSPVEDVGCSVGKQRLSGNSNPLSGHKFSHALLIALFAMAADEE